MATPELKPCPFCGGEVFFDKMFVGNADEYCIACALCDCVFTISWLSPDKESLAESWNMRANGVKVVRCKDCKHRNSPYNCPMRKLVMPVEGPGAYEDCTEDDGYCHKGERKESGMEV